MCQMEAEVTNKCMVVCCLKVKAVQILLSLIHCALGVLCDRLFVREEKTQNAGVVPVLVIVVYSLSTAPFFLTSGSMSVSSEKKPIRYKLISASVMNIFSACLSALGTIMLCIACFSFSSEKNEYVWSHLAGSMLLQYLLFSTISELLVTSITIVWIVRALHHPETSEETNYRSPHQTAESIRKYVLSYNSKSTSGGLQDQLVQ